MVPPEAIRIEDEVWQEAFARREPARGARERRLRTVEGGQRLAAPPPEDGLAATTRPRSSAEGEPRSSVQAVPERIDPVPAARRTIKIQGRGAERNMTWPDASRRRPPRRAYERAGFRPDRLAKWAVLLGFLLVLVAVASGHG
jgi:hypothetical protein